MHISQLKDSKFLTKTDVGTGVIVTIKKLEQENVAKSGAPEELKWVCWFAELDKPMVLNNTNGQIMAMILKSEETDDWSGQQVVLYEDPTIQFAGKIVGGIRVRAPRLKAAAPKPAPRVVQQEEEDESNAPF